MVHKEKYVCHDRLSGRGRFSLGDLDGDGDLLLALLPVAAGVHAGPADVLHAAVHAVEKQPHVLDDIDGALGRGFPLLLLEQGGLDDQTTVSKEAITFTRAG